MQYVLTLIYFHMNHIAGFDNINIPYNAHLTTPWQPRNLNLHVQISPTMTMCAWLQRYDARQLPRCKMERACHTCHLRVNAMDVVMARYSCSLLSSKSAHCNTHWKYCSLILTHNQGVWFTSTTSDRQMSGSTSTSMKVTPRPHTNVTVSITHISSFDYHLPHAHMSIVTSAWITWNMSNVVVEIYRTYSTCNSHIILNPTYMPCPYIAWPTTP